jgi:hypothetical protein
LFTNQHDLDGSLIGKGLFHLEAEAAGEFGRPEVIDLTRVHDDPKFAPGLEGVGLPDAIEGEGDLLQETDALGVGLEGGGAGAGAGAGGGVGDHHQRSVEAFGRNLAVVGGHRVHDAKILA